MVDDIGTHTPVYFLHRPGIGLNREMALSPRFYQFIVLEIVYIERKIFSTKDLKKKQYNYSVYNRNESVFF